MPEGDEARAHRPGALDKIRRRLGAAAGALFLRLKVDGAAKLGSRDDVERRVLRRGDGRHVAERARHRGVDDRRHRRAHIAAHEHQQDGAAREQRLQRDQHSK
ncbi:MAG: hypothetical protein FJ137_07020 [Deltaproteobacteria bacterium]|nr:hypothetical protein [Deltaproteobacteria bacterium]